MLNCFKLPSYILLNVIFEAIDVLVSVNRTGIVVYNDFRKLITADLMIFLRHVGLCVLT